MPITYIPLFFEKNDPCFAMWLWHYTTDWTRSGCLTCTWRLTWGLVDDPIRLLGKRAEALLKGVFSFMDPGRPNILGSCCTTATSRRRSTQLYFQDFSMIILNEGKKKWTTWGTVFRLPAYLCSLAWERKVQWQRCHQLRFLLHVGPWKEERRPLWVWSQFWCLWVVGWFPLINRKFSNTSSMSCKLTQLWYYLPGDRIRLHRLRAQSYKTTPLPWTLDVNHKSRSSPVLLTNWLQTWEVLTIPSLGSQNLGEHVTY